MTTPKSGAERQRAYRARRALEALTEVRGIFAEEADHPVVKRAAHNAIDLSGQQFGRLTVEEKVPREAGQTNARWRCVCDCGGVVIRSSNTLRRGTATSCGCLKKELISALKTTHGHARKGAKSSSYTVWKDMIKRCQNQNHKHYHRYGGRGISVCDRWLSFAAFLSDMGERPSKELTLDRIDCNGNYEPANCRWATWEQQQNNRSSNRLITRSGKTQTISQWAKEAGLNPRTLGTRLNKGVDPDSELFLSAALDDSRMVEYQGRSQTATAWAKELGINSSTFRKRLDRGWTVERAIQQSVTPCAR